MSNAVEQSLERDPYAVLNVSRDANLEDIRAAYKRACISFHPDKHPADRKQSAEAIFALVQTSYTILSDPKQRQIYDQLGWKGVSAAWQIGPHLSGIEEVMRKLEEERRRIFNKPMACKTTIQAQIDATGLETALTVDLGAEDGNDWLWLDFVPGVKGVSIGQRFEQVFDNGVVASLGMDVLTRAGMGAGSMSFGVQKAVDPFTKVSVGLGMGTERHLSASVTRQILKGTSIGMAFNGKVFGGTIAPTFQFSLNKMMMEKCMISTAVVTHGDDTPNSVIVSGNYLSETRPTTITCNVKQDGQFAVDLKHRHVIDEEHNVKIKLSTLRSRLSLGVVKVFSEDVKLMVALELSADLGTVVKVSFTRYDYHFVIPVIISSDITSLSLAMATSLPLAIASAIKSAVKWHQRRRQVEYWANYRREREGYINRLKEEAMLAQWLMQDQYDLAKECKLKITSAIYRQRGDPQANVDLTVPLQLLIVNDGLHVAPGQLAHIIGSYDVSIGADKELSIDYLFNGHAHHAVLPDHQPIILPQRSHIKTKI